ncbi:MAG: YhfC family intramembrane metalloprotease [Oscillospiraceae bacterium]|nr:YhfC family intramembrane metalloprotease [Oscillospiraceae bacterium]
MIEHVPALNVALLFISGLFCLIFPIALLIVWKIKNRSAKLIAALAGAVTFFAWALCLEQALHMVMLPLVQGSAVLYTIYGALAAGVFEETGRFVTYKLFLRKTTAEGNPADAVMYGIGHGGIEAVMLLSVNLLTYGMIAVMINAGMGETILGAMMASVPEEQTALAQAQLESYFLNEPIFYILGSVERVLAITLHIMLSVTVFAAAHDKKLLWLFPASILAHALFDTPVALYQVGVCPMWLMYALLVVFLIAMLPVTIKLYKKLKAEYNN